MNLPRFYNEKITDVACCVNGSTWEGLSYLATFSELTDSEEYTLNDTHQIQISSARWFWKPHTFTQTSFALTYFWAAVAPYLIFLSETTPLISEFD